MNEITWNEFTQVELRTGTIIEILDFPEARNPSYKLVIDFGVGIGIRKSSAQITDLYSKKDLLGKQIVAVVNFPKKQIGKFMSECLVTGFYNSEKQVVLAVPDMNVENGMKIA